MCIIPVTHRSWRHACWRLIHIRMSVDVTQTNESRTSVEWVSMSHIRMSVDVTHTNECHERVSNECRCHTYKWVSRTSVEWVSMSHIRMSHEWASNECRCHTYEWVSTNTPDSYVWHDSSIRVTCDSSCASVMKCTVISWVSFFLSFFLSLAFFFLFSWMLKTWLNYLVIPRQVTLAQLLAVVSAPKGQNSPQCF